MLQRQTNTVFKKNAFGFLSVVKRLSSTSDNNTEITMVALKLIILGMLVAVAVADSENTKKKPVTTLSEKSFVKEDGYSFEFKTSDGVSRQEDAQLITVGDHQGIGVKGSYSYVAPDGLEYLVTYTADEKGYKPQIRVLPHQGDQ